MPSDYFHGSRTIDYEEGARYIETVESSTVGEVVIADDADNDVFPFDEVVGFAGYDDSLIGKAGDTGTLAKGLDAIYDQGYAPLTAIVRVKSSKDAKEQRTNVIAGFEKLLNSQNKLGFTPRIIGAPGLDKDKDVAAQALVMADKLKAFAYIAGVGKDISAVQAYRQNFGSKRAMMIWPDFSDADGDLLATARALGLRAKIDNEIGWHRVISNYVVNGVTGINKDVSFNLQSGDTEANFLNSHEITTLIQKNGFRFWGGRHLAGGKYPFESYTRTSDILGYSFAQAMFDDIDEPMSIGLIKDIIESINQKYTQLTRDGFILGGGIELKQEDNLSSELMNGRLTVKRRHTPTPPLEDLLQKQTMTDEFTINLFG